MNSAAPWARGVSLLVLALAGLSLLAWVHGFGQSRYFTIDEYQFGHATWLVSEGERPYLDFYEHHFPLGYAAHAPLLPDEGPFSERALWLRRVSFAYLLLACGALLAGGWVATANPFVALLGAILPLGFGFGLLSAVEYRADNFAASLLLVCLSLLEANRRLERRGVAWLCGALLAVCVLMTQKMVYFGLGTLACMLAVDLLRRRFGGPGPPPLVVHPSRLLLGTAAGLGVGVVVSAGLGLLGQAWQLTLVDALRHERSYPPVGAARFAAPFLRDTAATTIPIVGLAIFHLFRGRDRFWWVPLVAVLVAGSLIRAQYPYNYVLLCWLLVLCAVRGYDDLLRWLPPPARMRSLRPLLYLLPLLLLPDQLGYASRASDNQGQLRLLDKIQAHTTPDDAVIDGAGGALFRDHGSYFYYHGGAQRLIFADYFERDLVEDYRRSRAPFWIRDVRLLSLPEVVRRYFREHYVQADGDLYALGFRVPRTGERGVELTVEVVRAGEYRLMAPLGGPQPDATREGLLRIDGRPLLGGAVWLEEGQHRLRVDPHAPPRILSWLPREVFEQPVAQGQAHSRLLEYGQ